MFFEQNRLSRRAEFLRFRGKRLPLVPLPWLVDRRRNCCSRSRLCRVPLAQGAQEVAMARKHRRLRPESYEELEDGELFRRMRKPLPQQCGRPIGTKKGERGYDRKRRDWEE